MSTPANVQFIEFKVDDLERFKALYQVFTEIKKDKEADSFREDNEWFKFFDKAALSHFMRRTAEENEAHWKQWYATPVEKRFSDPMLETPWDFLSMIDAFKYGEYTLVDCSIISGNKARLEFEAWAWPYGGTGCMKALIKAFDFKIIGEDDGTGYYQRYKEFITEPYSTQMTCWPKSGRHILAQFDSESVVVYQAYRPSIGHFAAKKGFFSGEFSLNRMSWIKPNFLWMMYRSGWGTKEGQEVTLAIWLERSAFDYLLAQAVHSSFIPEIYSSESEWKQAVADSDVRLQWDPDHDPSGAKLERRAIQLGMRGEVLKQYSHTWILQIEDISEFVAEQRQHAKSSPYDQLITPREEVYPVTDPIVVAKLDISNSI